MQEAAAKTALRLEMTDQNTQQAMEHDESIVFSAPILCYYMNATKRIQVVRLSHLTEGEWEHILFPAQNFMFEAPPEAMLEVYKSPTLSVVPPEHILCRTLQVQSE
jgi:Domain of unknown function (DUF1830)